MNNLFIKRIKAFSLCCLRFNQFFRAALLFNPFVTPPRDCIIDHTYLSISIYIFPIYIYIYNLSSSTLCIFFFFFTSSSQNLRYSKYPSTRLIPSRILFSLPSLCLRSSHESITSRTLPDIEY